MSVSYESKRIRAHVRATLQVALAICAMAGVLVASSGAAAQAVDAGQAAPPPNDGAAVLGEPTPAPPPAPPPADPNVPPADPNVPPGGYVAAPPPTPEAYGQPQQPVYVPPIVIPATEAPPARPEHARTDDANADHIVLGSTAFTAPKGSVYFSDYDIFLIQAGVAVTDNFQLTLTSLLPVVEDQPFFLDVSAKVAFLQTPRFHMAAIGSLLGITNAGVDVPVVGRLGLVATACITANCYVNASASALFWFTSETTSVVPVTLNLGVSARLAGIFSLLAEVNGLATIGSARVSSDLFRQGVLIGYGARFSNANFGFDLTFVKPIVKGLDDFPLPFGVPWLTFTYRSNALF